MLQEPSGCCRRPWDAAGAPECCRSPWDAVGVPRMLAAGRQGRAGKGPVCPGEHFASHRPLPHLSWVQPKLPLECWAVGFGPCPPVPTKAGPFLEQNRRLPAHKPPGALCCPAFTLGGSPTGTCSPPEDARGASAHTHPRFRQGDPVPGQCFRASCPSPAHAATRAVQDPGSPVPLSRDPLSMPLPPTISFSFPGAGSYFLGTFYFFSPLPSRAVISLT